MIDLSELSDIELYHLWEKGNSYHGVLYALADKETLTRKNELFELSQAYSKEKTSNMISNPPEKIGLLDLIETITDQPYKAEENKIEYQLHWNVVNALKSGQIIALGFEHPRKISARPIEIPTDIIENGKNTFSSVFRDNKKIKKGNIKIEEVCFVWRQHVDNALSITTSGNSNSLVIDQYSHEHEENPSTKNKSVLMPTKVGRTSRKPEILQAFNTLSSENKVSINTPIQTLGHLVREFILKKTNAQSPRKTGLSDETIRRIIRTQNNTK